MQPDGIPYFTTGPQLSCCLSILVPHRAGETNNNGRNNYLGHLSVHLIKFPREPSEDLESYRLSGLSGLL